MAYLFTQDGKILLSLEDDNLTGVIIHMANGLIPRLSRRKTDASKNVWIEVPKTTEVVINGVKQ